MAISVTERAQARAALGLTSLALASLLLGGCVSPGETRLAAFQQVLADHDSATVALTQWCDAQAISDPATITARPNAGAPIAADAQTLALLEVGSQADLAYRNVALACGAVTLSYAHNWYVPARLTAQMNEALNTTGEPFGRVVAPLGFTRERLPDQLGAQPGCPPDTVLSHGGVLRLRDGTPISRVIECYTPATIAPPSSR